MGLIISPEMSLLWDQWKTNAKRRPPAPGFYSLKQHKKIAQG
jgi:hypothetical protein